jgi:hypothetical protein
VLPKHVLRQQGDGAWAAHTLGWASKEKRTKKRSDDASETRSLID